MNFINRFEDFIEKKSMLYEARGIYKLPYDQMITALEKEGNLENVWNKLNPQIYYAKKAGDHQRAEILTKVREYFKGKGTFVVTPEKKEAFKQKREEKRNAVKEKFTVAKVGTPEYIVQMMTKENSPKEAVKLIQHHMKKNPNSEDHEKLLQAIDILQKKLKEIDDGLNNDRPTKITNNSILGSKLTTMLTDELAVTLNTSRQDIHKLTKDGLKKIYKNVSKNNPDTKPSEIVAAMIRFFNPSTKHELKHFKNLLPKQIKEDLNTELMMENLITEILNDKEML